MSSFALIKVTLVSDRDKTVVRVLMDYYLEIKANSDTFKTKSLIMIYYSGILPKGKLQRSKTT